MARLRAVGTVVTFRAGMLVLAAAILLVCVAVRAAWHGYLFTAFVLVCVALAAAVTVSVSVLKGKDW